MSKVIDLSGQQFGMLTVVERAGSSQHGEAIWLCLCKCGKKRHIRGDLLRFGRVNSCGCARRQALSVAMTGERNPRYKHGLHGQRLYVIWSNMKQRCNNPNANEYDAYGGRGITVCPEWQHDAKAFYDWAMSHGYRDDLTIDRIDNDKGYSPDNCRWIPQSEQYANMQNRKH